MIKITIPLPPFAEQRRIVAKADELMALCDRLEEQLLTAQEEKGRLLEAVINQALTQSNAPPRTQLDNKSQAIA